MNQPLNQSVRLLTNAAWNTDASRPVLSILIPYYRFDCSQLVAELLSQASSIHQPVELLLADDGSADEKLNRSLESVLHNTPIPIHWSIFSENRGRAAIRNLLVNNARADYLLFLDCDMLPDSKNFLDTYLQAIETDPETLAFVGGRSYLRLPGVKPEERLYHYFSQRTECLSADDRQQYAAWYVFTNNIVIKREALLDQPFDDSFQGWGFEDTDWGLRVARLGKLRHIDNSATHLGVMTDTSLLEKYRESVTNFQYMLIKHPVDTRRFPVTRMALKLSLIKPLLGVFSLLASLLATRRFLPLSVRFGALQIFRALLYAAALTPAGSPSSSGAS